MRGMALGEEGVAEDMIHETAWKAFRPLVVIVGSAAVTAIILPPFMAAATWWWRMWL